MSITAMKQALEALENIMLERDLDSATTIARNARYGLRQAIQAAEKQEQDTLAYREEDEAFNMVEQNSNLGKQILKHIEGQPYHYDIYVSPTQRNFVLEEVAQAFDKMPFGDTAASFAVFVRNMKK